MASYDGANIFGQSVSMVTTFAPRAQQRTEYFGLDGVEHLDGGSRGGVTIVTGVLIGEDMADYLDAYNDFLAKKDGLAHVLVDTEGTSHPEAVLMDIQPQGRLRKTAGGKCFRPYSARFDHLV